jgi:hypothetical protein
VQVVLLRVAVFYVNTGGDLNVHCSLDDSNSTSTSTSSLAVNPLVYHLYQLHPTAEDDKPHSESVIRPFGAVLIGFEILSLLIPLNPFPHTPLVIVFLIGNTE